MTQPQYYSAEMVSPEIRDAAQSISSCHANNAVLPIVLHIVTIVNS